MLLVLKPMWLFTMPDNSRITSPPHPFVIEPPLSSEKNFPKGTSFDFYLLLFGEINNSLFYFIYAFDQMGKIGIGRKIYAFIKFLFTGSPGQTNSIWIRKD